MLKNKLLASIAFYATAYITSTTLVAADNYTIIGSQSCAKWIENREKADNAKETLGELASMRDEAWILGFVSGLNAGLSLEKDTLARVDYAIIYDWTDKYCKSHPEKKIYEGAIQLFEKILRSREKQPVTR